MENNDIIRKLSRFAFISAVIGVCTIGICPAFGAIGIAVPLTLKRKKFEVSDEIASLNKKSLFAGIVSLVMFVIDLILIIFLKLKFGLF
ncbi:MAG: hypothetical protein J1E05_06775 [Eubacterium sp.]|nr:hypothetical protein [Eubacterium sp.]